MSKTAEEETAIAGALSPSDGSGLLEVDREGVGARDSACEKAALTPSPDFMDSERRDAADATSRKHGPMQLGPPGASAGHVDSSTVLRNVVIEAAELASRNSDWTKAAHYLDWAISISPSPRLSFRLGGILFRLGRLDACLEAFEDAARHPDFFERAVTQIVKVHQRRRASNELLTACERLLRHDAGNLWALRQIYTQYIVLQDFSAARLWFSAAHWMDPTDHPWAFFELLRLERLGRLTAALAPYSSDFDPREFPEGMKERLANLFYASGRYHSVDLCAQAMLTRDARRVTYAKLSAATGRPKFDVAITEIPTTRAGRIVRALEAYLDGSRGQSVAELDAAPERASDRLAIGNFRALATSGCVLSNRLFDAATIQPHDGETLPVVNQLWVGDALSYVERLSIRSFIACGHEVHLYAYNGDLPVPPGCVLKDAEEIMPRSEIFVHSAKTGRNAGSLAGFADLFRWKLIHEKGGAWADCDVICLEPIQSHRMVSTELVNIEGVIVPAITNCFFAAERGDPALRKAFETVKRTSAEDLQWGEAGIHQMARLVAEEGWGDRLTSPSDICPIPSFRMIDALAGSIDVASIIATTNCRAVHLYNETMRDAGLDKNASFPPKSLIMHLKQLVAQREADRRSAHGQSRLP